MDGEDVRIRVLVHDPLIDGTKLFGGRLGRLRGRAGLKLLVELVSGDVDAIEVRDVVQGDFERNDGYAVLARIALGQTGRAVSDDMYSHGVLLV